MKASVGQKARSEHELLLEDRGNTVPFPEFGTSVVVIERMSYLGMKVHVALTDHHNYYCYCYRVRATVVHVTGLGLLLLHYCSCDFSIGWTACRIKP